MNSTKKMEEQNFFTTLFVHKNTSFTFKYFLSKFYDKKLNY